MTRELNSQCNAPLNGVLPKLIASTLTTVALLSSTLLSQEIDVKITNNTNGIYFTPLLVSAHPVTTALFMSGDAASANLQAMAEGGDISGLSADLALENADSVENPASGLLAPGGSTMTSLSTAVANTNLSIVAMMLPTNDGFVALNNWIVPTTAGTYTININAYDAGTEANSELITDIPADPGSKAGTGATGVTTAIEGYVHIHRGSIGDSDASGGASDLNVSAHRWLNPVATITVTVK